MSTASGSASFWQVARRPRWIAALLLVLAVAAAFAYLGRWQLERSIAAGTVNTIDTETPVPLASVAEPGVPVLAEAYARVVDTAGAYDPEGFVVLEGRLQHGETGYWLVGRFVTAQSGPVSLAVALGWAESREDADAAAEEVAAEASSAAVPLRGRYLPSESPRFEDALEGRRAALAVADLINAWPGYTGEVYAGYLIAAEAPAGLEAIDAPPPLPEQQVNLLNLFYAIEWIVFAGFAVYLWWRLVKDEVEKRAGSAAAVPREPTVD